MAPWTQLLHGFWIDQVRATNPWNSLLSLCLTVRKWKKHAFETWEVCPDIEKTLVRDCSADCSIPTSIPTRPEGWGKSLGHTLPIAMWLLRLTAPSTLSISQVVTRVEKCFSPFPKIFCVLFVNTCRCFFGLWHCHDVRSILTRAMAGTLSTEVHSDPPEIVSGKIKAK